MPFPSCLHSFFWKISWLYYGSSTVCNYFIFSCYFYDYHFVLLFFKCYWLCYYRCPHFFSLSPFHWVPSCSIQQSTPAVHPLISVGHAYKFLGYSISYTVFNIPRLFCTYQFVLNNPCSFYQKLTLPTPNWWPSKISLYQLFCFCSDGLLSLFFRFNCW